MHFASLILSLAVATVALATPTPAKRGDYYYYSTFYDLDGATEASDYLTYKLVATVQDCFGACDETKGCGFVNTYHDVNGKNGSSLLTCSLYKTCHDADTATNKGGQTQPDGKVDYITYSSGWCKY